MPISTAIPIPGIPEYEIAHECKRSGGFVVRDLVAGAMDVVV